MGRKVKACDLKLYEQLLQRSPLNTEMSENGIVKSTAELKAEIKKFKLGKNAYDLADKIQDNLKPHIKNMQLHMVFLHNNKKIQGQSQYNAKLHSLEQNQSSSNGMTSNMQNLKNKNIMQSLNAGGNPTKSIKTVMLLYRLANRRLKQENNKTIEKSINMTQTSSQLVRIEGAPCVQINTKNLLIFTRLWFRC